MLSSVVAAVISLILHELAHMALVRAFGGEVSGFRFSFVGIVAWVRGVYKFKRWQRYAVYLAGPVSNALIAFGAWGVARLFYGPQGFMENIFLYNVVFCVFNLLPVFPLDGGRIAQLWLGNHMGVLRANRLLLWLGPVVGTVLMCIGLVQVVLYPWNITLVCAGYYIKQKNKQLPTQLYWECIQALKAKQSLYTMQKFTSMDEKQLPTIRITLPKSTTVASAVGYLRWDYWVEIEIAPGCIISEDVLLEMSHVIMDVPSQ